MFADSINQKLINGQVYNDYRDNILIDKDNPILAFKANRDRYIAKSQEKYAGLPQISSVYSEDALTWNVFRTLDKNGRVGILSSLLGKLNDPLILLWTLAFSEKGRDLQYQVGSMIRAIDGKFGGQITEPDLIIMTKDRFIVAECKLGRPGERPSHLWEAQSSIGPERRFDSYFSNQHPFVACFDRELYRGDGYQLFRMGFYAYYIGMSLGKKPELLSITNRNWWDVKSGKESASSIWEHFLGQVDPQKLSIKNVFWQDILECIDDNQELLELKDYLRKHICLG